MLRLYRSTVKSCAIALIFSTSGGCEAVLSSTVQDPPNSLLVYDATADTPPSVVDFSPIVLDFDRQSASVLYRSVGLADCSDDDRFCMETAGDLGITLPRECSQLINAGALGGAIVSIDHGIEGYDWIFWDVRFPYVLYLYSLNDGISAIFYDSSQGRFTAGMSPPQMVTRYPDYVLRRVSRVPFFRCS